MRISKLETIGLITVFLFTATPVFAERGGGGRSNSGGNFHPRGWDKGEKKGWEGKEHPPGLEKGKKKGWKKKETDHPPGWDKGKKSE